MIYKAHTEETKQVDKMAVRYFFTNTNTTIVTDSIYCTLKTYKKTQKMPYKENKGL